MTRPGGHVLVVDQLAPDDPGEAAALHEFETTRDPSHARLLSAAELQGLFAEHGLSLVKARNENEQRDLAAYLDLADCEGDRRADAEALAAADPRVLDARVGWYLLARP